jgi:hypothetical protein
MEWNKGQRDNNRIDVRQDDPFASSAGLALGRAGARPHVHPEQGMD